jgi:hypothetical protein
MQLASPRESNAGQSEAQQRECRRFGHHATTRGPRSTGGAAWQKCIRPGAEDDVAHGCVRRHARRRQRERPVPWMCGLCTLIELFALGYAAAVPMIRSIVTSCGRRTCRFQ